MVPQPRVSVCIPVGTGARHLAATVRSVLDQTHRDLELVVVGDDACLADTDPRLRVEPRPGDGNVAVRAGRAPLVKLVRPGDLLHPRCLEFQVPALESDPGLALVASRRHLVDEQSRVIVPRRGLTGLTGVRSGATVARRVVRTGSNPIGGPACVLFRREQFDAAGGWRADRTVTTDIDLWMRLLRHGDLLGLPACLAAFRIGRSTVAAPGATAGHAEQVLLATEVAAAFAVRGLDRTVGRLLAPAGRLRQGGRSALSRLSARRAGRCDIDLAVASGP